jgi:hypothetical protein
MSEAAPRRPSRGSSGGCRKSTGLARWRPTDLSMEGVLGSEPRGVGASREDGSSAPRRGAASVDPHGGATESVSGTSVRLVRCRTSAHRSAAHHQRGSPIAGGRNEPQLATATHNRGAIWGRSCWQQHLGVGDEFSAFSACKRTRHEAADEAPIGIAQATSSGILRSVGTRGHQSAAEIAKGYLASPGRPCSFGRAIGKTGWR